MRALLLVSLALTGCLATFPLDGEVYVDPRLSPRKQYLIQQAMDDWCKATSGRACPRIVPGRGPFEFVVETRSGHNAITRQRFRTVQIGIDLLTWPAGSQLAAVKHEIGHAYDLEHAPKGLMRGAEQGGPQMRKGVRTDCIDRRTLEAFNERHGAGPIQPECDEP